MDSISNNKIVTLGNGVNTSNSNVPIQAKSPFYDYIHNWYKYLSDHPDPKFTEYIVNGICKGVDIGYTGPRRARVHDNWPSVSKYNQAVSKVLTNDVVRGRKAGPFATPPFKNFVGSPMGAFPKKHSPDKYRVIHDLSWPPGASINEGIDLDCSVQYITVDTVVRHVKKCGPGALMAKIDLEDAYKHIMVQPSDWELLGLTFDTIDKNNNGSKQFYVDLTLPFGLKSSAKIFSKFAEGLHYIMQARGVTIVENYLDDFFTCGQVGTPECYNNLSTMISTCKILGWGLQCKKIVRPTTELEFLGIVIDSVHRELKISDQRLNDIMKELQVWSYKKVCKKRELLSLIGKLSFISRVVRPGRTFLRRLIDLSKRVKYLHHRIKLSKESLADINWWIQYLPTWNGISLFYNESWESNDRLEWWSDASDTGYGCFFQGSWISENFNANCKSEKSIAWRELYALYVAACTWGERLKGKRILFHCDNSAIVQVLEKGTSKEPQIMNLVRSLFFVAAHNNFEFSAVHIPGKKNEIADALSRGQLTRFRKLAPNAELCKTKVHVKMIV